MKDQELSFTISLTAEMIDAIADRVIEKQKLDVVTPINENLYYKAKEVARLVNKSTTTIYRHVEQGLLIAKKSGNTLLITQENLTNYANGTN